MSLTISIPTETKKNGMNFYTIEGFIEVRNVPEGIPWNIFTEMGRYSQKPGETIPYFDEARNIVHGFYMNYICVEYADASVREGDKANNQSRYDLINLFQSRPQDEKGRQIARNVGEFEYNGKCYLVISPRNTPLAGSDTIPERGIFKGVIVDMEKYNSTKSKPEILESQVVEKVETIFPHKN